MKIDKGVDLSSPLVEEIAFRRGDKVLAFQVAAIDMPVADRLEVMFPMPDPPLGGYEKDPHTNEYVRDMEGNIRREIDKDNPVYLEALHEQGRRRIAATVYYGLRHDAQITWEADPKLLEANKTEAFFTAISREIDKSGMLPGELIDIHDKIRDLTYPNAQERSRIAKELRERFLSLHPEEVEPAPSYPGTTPEASDTSTSEPPSDSDKPPDGSEG